MNEIARWKSKTPATNGCIRSLAIGDAGTFLVGYYLWCCAGLAILCASPFRWPTLLILALGPMARVYFTKF